MGEREGPGFPAERPLQLLPGAPCPAHGTGLYLVWTTVLSPEEKAVKYASELGEGIFSMLFRGHFVWARTLCNTVTSELAFRPNVLLTQDSQGRDRVPQWYHNKREKTPMKGGNARALFLPFHVPDLRGFWVTVPPSPPSREVP